MENVLFVFKGNHAAAQFDIVVLHIFLLHMEIHNPTPRGIWTPCTS